ncbi:MAG: 3,4-dihydroxy-2-butanone-4-phosphate synthase [Saprospiraceae bacterium]|nr:MAG: 3,4-dihydroxy-2-butanone-4-phosphate synthase [Saprospiraceae bacterium]
MSGNHQKETDQPDFKLNTIEEAIEDIKAGKVIIVVDDEDRENEGDFICAAECVTPEIINFMATHGRGLICTPIDEKRVEELELNMMVTSNTALHETAFTVSIDLIGQGCTTGISAYDRATGIRALIDPKTKATDFARPGHIFPLKAKTGGVLRRTGHTEASIDLAKLAGFYPAGVLVEVLDEDGSPARLPKLMKIAERFDLKIIAINDLVAYRMRNERIIKKEIAVNINTRFGDFEVIAYRQITTNDIHLAIKKGDWEENEPVLIRVHSSTETGDIIGSLFGGYAQQLEAVLNMISEEGKGLLLYMRHGEKGDAMLHLLQDIQEKQSKGESPSLEGRLESEQRDYGVGAQILRDLGVTKMRVISNHPKRRIGLIGYGLEIIENIPL